LKRITAVFKEEETAICAALKYGVKVWPALKGLRIGIPW
jgi:hypothetical protein